MDDENECSKCHAFNCSDMVCGSCQATHETANRKKRDEELVEGLAKWISTLDMSWQAGTDDWKNGRAESEKVELRKLARAAITQSRGKT